MEFKGSYREWIADRKASQANYRVEWGEHPLETASVLTDMQSSSISIQGEGQSVVRKQKNQKCWARLSVKDKPNKMEDARPVGHVRRIQKARYDTEHSRQLMEHRVRDTDKAGQYFFFFLLFPVICYSYRYF
jgi:hypothetical protein